MAQESVKQIPVSESVKIELERRKKVLSKRIGRKVNYDMVLRDMLGWL